MKIKLKKLKAFEKELWNIGEMISKRLNFRTTFDVIEIQNTMFFEETYVQPLPIAFKSYSDMGNETHRLTLEDVALISIDPDKYFAPFEAEFKARKMKEAEAKERRERAELTRLLEKYGKE